MRAKRVDTRGFTLVELLVVIAIIGILAGFLLPAIGRARFSARMGRVRADLRALADACDAYFSENGTYPPMGNDWVRIGPNGLQSMGPGHITSRYVEGNRVFYPSEDVGTDGEGPFKLSLADPSDPQWIVNPAYSGPDADGSEGNYKLDPGEDIGLDLIEPTDGEYATGRTYEAGSPSGADTDGTEGNGRLDGLVFARLLGVDATAQAGMEDEIFQGSGQFYHYYPGRREGPPADLTGFASLQTLTPVYTACVVYSVGPDQSDSGLHNYYTATQRETNGGGADRYVGDPSDDGSGTANAYSDNDGIRIEQSINETRSGQTGERVFDYDYRLERQARGPDLTFALPSAPREGDGVMMLVRGG